MDTKAAKKELYTINSIVTAYTGKDINLLSDKLKEETGKGLGDTLPNLIADQLALLEEFERLQTIIMAIC